MGCDIHPHLEVKVDGTWLPSLIELESSRHYAWFEFLVGVRARHGWTPHHTSRGLPLDVSSVVRKDFEAWEGDAHTPSYITKRELADIPRDLHLPFYDNTLKPIGELFEAYLNNWCEVMQHFEDARVVFWFDC